jgi:primary-amine oxidase
MPSVSADSTSAQRSALDPLTPEEISRSVAVARAWRDLGPRVQFVSVSTAEPLRGATVFGPRGAEMVLHDADTRRTTELRIDLEREEVTDCAELTGVEPQMTAEEFLEVEAAVRRAPEFLAALRRRGIDDVSLVDVDPVSAGSYGRPEEQGSRRLARVLAYVRPDEGGNAYARPLEGIFGLVDVRTGELVFFEDRDPVPLPAETGEFRADRIAMRDDVRPIHISQPEGPSFTVDGHDVRWQKWSLRVGFSQREGLVLHRIAYEDDGQVRPILHRASYAEMVVPYADPDRFYQTPLDIGEFNIGTMTNSLVLGCDCLGVIHYFDGAYVNAKGEPVVVPNAICLHEEDDGLLWKHTDFRTDHVEVRRGRRLVISSIATVGNYEYGFFWYLHQDGAISSEVKATGIVATQAVAENEATAYGKLVAPHLNAIHHQHIFCARLDFDLDGGGNSVIETHTEAIPQGPDNPHGNAWVTKSRTFATEMEARRHIDPLNARTWTVVNPTKRNAVGQPVGYRLIAGENTLPFSASDSSARRRAAFMDYHLWVTPYAPTERYPAGMYPYQHPGDDGLPSWVQADRSIEDTDLVVWYTMNHHHVPRPEDWPVMPVARIGFMLKPWGFFDRSPALDVPPTEPGAGSSHAPGSCCDLTPDA